MTAAELWAELARLGATATRNGDTLEVRPAAALTTSLRAAIREHKAEVLDMVTLAAELRRRGFTEARIGEVLCVLTQ
jgi:hypothetical protein